MRTDCVRKAHGLNADHIINFTWQNLNLCPTNTVNLFHQSMCPFSKLWNWPRLLTFFLCLSHPICHVITVIYIWLMYSVYMLDIIIQLCGTGWDRRHMRTIFCEVLCCVEFFFEEIYSSAYNLDNFFKHCCLCFCCILFFHMHFSTNS